MEAHVLSAVNFLNVMCDLACNTSTMTAGVKYKVLCKWEDSIGGT